MKKFILTMAVILLVFTISDVIVPDQAQALDPWACSVAAELGYSSRNWNILCVWMMALEDDDYAVVMPLDTKQFQELNSTPFTDSYALKMSKKMPIIWHLVPSWPASTTIPLGEISMSLAT